jgi:hypothetical protein
LRLNSSTFISQHNVGIGLCIINNAGNFIPETLQSVMAKNNKEAYMSGQLSGLKDLLGGKGGENPLDGVMGSLAGTKSLELSGSLVLKSCHNKFLSAQPDGTARWDRERATEWERIEAEPQGQGKVAFKSCHNKYLGAQPDGSVQWNQAKPGEEETWTVEASGEGIALKAANGKYLSVQQDGSVQANRDAAKGWETFTVVKL